jgi:hypothetical protein
MNDAIYAGEVVHTGATDASRRLVADVYALLRDALGPSPRDAAHDLFARIGAIRRELYLAPRWHRALRDVIAARGIDPARVAFDPLRLRVVLSGGHRNPAAAPVYYPHRDTWYAHPQALVAWWIPLDDLPAAETFEFYPERFRAPVANDSEVFDYDDWVRDGWELKIGWQVPAERARYPRAADGVDRGRAIGFSCRAGDHVVFSGAQFHATRAHDAGRTRFSLDFRTVDLADHAAGKGAPNVDNRSRGSALRDYVR